MPSAMAANTKPEPDICMCKAWGKGGVDPANGESGKGVNEGRRAADAFEKRAHIPTVCRQSLPGRPQCTDRRSGRPLPPKPSGPNMRPAPGTRTEPPRAVPSPRRDKAIWHINGQSTHPRATPPARFRAAFRGFAAVPHSGHSSGAVEGPSVNCRIETSTHVRSRSSNLN